MVKIETLQKENFENLQGFLEESYFHFHNFFPLRYPHVWKKENIDYKNSHIIRENGKIASFVRIFPLVGRVGNQKIKIGGIGGVSTHPNYRGKGYMRKLMDFCVRKMREENYAFSILGGDRQRYNFWKYETAGLETVFYITSRSIEKSGGSKIVKIKKFYGEDKILSKIIKSHENFPLRMERKKEDYIALLLQRFNIHTWYAEEENKFAYLSLERRIENAEVIEIGGEVKLWIPLIYSLIKVYGINGMEIYYPYLSDKGFLTLYEKAGSFRIQPFKMIKILSLKRTLLGLQDELCKKFKEGMLFTFKVKDTEEEFSIGKEKGKIKVSKENSGEKIELSEIEWVRLIFGPFSSIISPPELRNIFPLKFYSWRLDRI